MTKDNKDIYFNCLQIEAIVKARVMKGKGVNKELVNEISQIYPPTNDWEREIYSEAILYAKYSILN